MDAGLTASIGAICEQLLRIGIADLFGAGKEFVFAVAPVFKQIIQEVDDYRR